jgi:gamma-tubulin complex component 4
MCNSRANYLLLRNGEFALAFIRELERLKLSRITARVTPSSMIREQDLQLVLLRASLGTSAQQDPLLANIRCHLPSGAARPLLPSLSGTIRQSDKSAHAELLDGLTSFDDVLLGTPMNLRYNVEWPLDLFLKTSDLKIYGALFSYIASLRKTHMLVHNTWGSLSNAQRARRRWTGLSEGGTQIDLQARKDLLRCSWGLVREMGWFLSTLLEYLMEDVVDAEYKRLKRLLSDTGPAPGGHGTHRLSNTTLTTKLNQQGRPTYLDFTTVQSIHAGYLNRILLSSGLVNAELTNIVRQIIDLCERLVAQVERWGGDVLPALLFEGSIATRTDGDGEAVGSMVRERWTIIAEMNAVCHSKFLL